MFRILKDSEASQESLNIKLTKYLHSHIQINLDLSFIRTIYLHSNVKIFPEKITIILKNIFNKQLPIKNYLLDRDSNLEPHEPEGSASNRSATHQLGWCSTK